MKREVIRMVLRLGSLVVVALAMATATVAVERGPVAALDCGWQSPSSFVANYEVTAQAEYSLRAQPYVGCEPIGAIFAGQTARVVAETGAWRYVQIQETGRWGWVHRGAFESQPPPGRGCPGNQEMVVVAHADDDIIFMNPTVDDRVRSGRCVVTVYVTAGDVGQDENYWSSRESGARAAHARMEDVSATTWRKTALRVNGRSLAALEQPSNPGAELVFLRLPDGFQGNGPIPGPGSQRYGFQSLQKLWSGEIASISAVDGSTSYSRQELIDTMAELIDHYDPSILHVQDYSNTGNRSDHSDHIHAARFAVAAEAQAAANPSIADYLGYGTSSFNINIHGQKLERKYDIFDEYARFDALVHHPIGLANPIAGAYTHSWLPREYRVGQSEPPVRQLTSGFLAGVGENCLRANGTQAQMSDCFNVASQRWQWMSDGKLRNDLGRCLDVVGGGRESGTRVQMFSCADVAAQQWILMEDGRLIGHPGNCLDVINGRTDPGAEVQMFSCVDVAAQKWRFSSSPPGGSPTVVRSGFLVGAGGNCLDVINGRTNNQAEVQMYDCVDVAAQKWQLMSNGELRGVGNNCLDVVNGGTANGTKVQMYDCVGVPAQQWSLLSNGSLRGIGNNCLDVINGGTVNGTRVQMYDCVDVEAQKWRFSSTVPDPVRVVRSGSLVGAGGNCLDVINGRTNNQAEVQMYDCVDVAAQKWQLMSNGELRGVGNNCLDVVNGGTANGTKVQMYDCVGVPAQQWSLNSSGELRGIGNNCLDVINGRTVNGTRVQMYDCVGVVAQRWRFE